MLRRTILAGLLLAPMILTACDNKDASGPQGTAGVVTVNAYVDANGSGTLDAGDVGLAKTITLTGADGTALTATTNASGVASFPSVPPGTYTVSTTAGGPAGAVLATASSPVVVVPFQGGNFTTEFRYVLNPGSISGQLFRDNNGNGAFDAGDTPAPGMTVSLYSGTDTTKAPVATTTTDNNGVFTFTTIRPGSYTVKVTPIPTIAIVGGNTSVVTVTANTATAVPVKFTGNLIGTIAEARAAAVGATVAFEGVATVAQNTFASPVSGGTTSQQIYVQDGNAGILVFNIGTATSIAVGDSVRVIGIRDVSFTEVRVGSSTAPPSISKIATVIPPNPKTASVSAVLGGQFQGQLITVSNLLVRSLGTVSSTTGSYNVNVQGATVADTFQVRIPSSNTGIPSSFFVPGQRYDVTGDLGVFNTLPNLKPRSLADVKLRSSALPIQTARQRSVGDTVTVEGVVYVGTGNFNAASAYIMDKTGGITIFNIPTGTTLVQGDSIRVRGLINVFSGETQIGRFSTSIPPVIEKLGTGTIPQPILIPFSALVNKDFDGSLVKLLGLTVTGIGTVSGTTGSYNVTATAPDGTTLVIRVDNAATGIPSTFWQIGTRYDVAGAAVNFVSGTTTTPQVKPRALSDISVSTTAAPARTIAQVKAAVPAGAAGFLDSATVDGVVIAGRGTFNAASIYIFDGTAGILVFNVPTTLTLVVGDYVRVHGKVVKFGSGQEIEFTSAVPTGDTFSVTKLGQGPIVGDGQLITGAQLVARVGEQQLVKLTDVTVTSIGTVSGTSGAYTVNATAADGTAIVIFYAAPAGAVAPPASVFTVGTHYDVTGIEVPFLPSGGTTIIGEVKPRGTFDVVAR